MPEEIRSLIYNVSILQLIRPLTYAPLLVPKMRRFTNAKKLAPGAAKDASEQERMDGEEDISCMYCK